MAIEVLVPSIIKIGGGAIADASRILKHLGVKHPLIVTDPVLARMGLAESLREQIEKAGIACGVFRETMPDPASCCEWRRAYKLFFGAAEHDGLVSLGGGSPIDSAKAIGILASNGGRASDYRVPNEIPNTSPLHLAVPTRRNRLRGVTLHCHHRFRNRREDAHRRSVTSTKCGHRRL